MNPRYEKKKCPHCKKIFYLGEKDRGLHLCPDKKDKKPRIKKVKNKEIK